jgi:hypothetical protein
MMRMSWFSSSLAVLALSMAGDAVAAASRLPAGVPPAAALLLRYDINGDGAVTFEEMEAGLKADHAVADTNKDGCLGSGEASEENARRLARDGAQSSPIRDWNLDGCVDIREFSNTAHSYFQLADRSKDSKVTMVELRGPSMPMAPPTQPSRRASARQSDQASGQSSLGSPQYQVSRPGTSGPTLGR